MITHKSFASPHEERRTKFEIQYLSPIVSIERVYYEIISTAVDSADFLD